MMAVQSGMIAIPEDRGNSRKQGGERLADDLEHLLERQEQLLKAAHVEHERLTCALRELATAMECERRARDSESPKPGKDTG